MSSGFNTPESSRLENETNHLDALDRMRAAAANDGHSIPAPAPAGVRLGGVNVDDPTQAPNYTANIWDVENLVEREISQGLTQKQIAMTYALALRSSYPTDWARVNRAILAKWPKGLERIKKMAHSGSCFKGV